MYNTVPLSFDSGGSAKVTHLLNFGEVSRVLCRCAKIIYVKASVIVGELKYL